MRKLLLIISTSILTSGAIANAPFFIETKIQNNKHSLQVPPHHVAHNATNTNEFGAHEEGVPVGHKNNFYVRFYMTGAIYNALNLVAQEAQKRSDPFIEFYSFFLGDEVNKYPLWAAAVNQYNNIMENYQTIYGVDLGQYIRNWFLKNYTYFYRVFMGRNISTNIYDYEKVNLRRMSEAKRSEYLTSIWRQIGIILTIPFHYDSTANSWGILANNVRIFPQYDGVDPLTYYYNGGSTYEEPNENPLMYVPVAKGVTNLILNSNSQFTMVENAFLTAINCPADLRRFYKTVANRGTTLHVPYDVTSPTTINFEIQITRLVVKKITLPVDFYLNPRV